MAVPESVRSVWRPVNTIVEDRGKDGPCRYAVRVRSSVRYVSGGNPQPHNGPVIGYIIDGRYVAKNARAGITGADRLSYGSSRLVEDVSGDIRDDLLAVFCPQDAMRIYAIAAVKVIKPRVTQGRMQQRYGTLFISKWHPGLALGENTIRDLYTRVGMDGEMRRKFYSLRMEAVAKEHHIAIDGTLKQDTSIVNDLSAFSHKARVKGCKDISILYAYDIERMEPICAEIFAGNLHDGSVYSRFISENHITKGILVDDKAFMPGKIAKELEECPDLHFLTPIKRNDSRIGNNDMLSWQGVLSGVDKRILYCKRRIRGGRFLYAFKDMGKAHGEENSFIDHIKDRKKDFTAADYDKTIEQGGIIVFESDLDDEPLAIYDCYQSRWLLELLFRRYKNEECLDVTRCQGDFTVQGEEFVNFIATLINARIVLRMEKAGVLKDSTYGGVMEDLTEAWRNTSAPVEAHSDDGGWYNVSEGVFPELEALGLSIPAPSPEKRKPGRPRKNPVPDPNAPKKKRGRPPKNKPLA